MPASRSMLTFSRLARIRSSHRIARGHFVKSLGAANEERRLTVVWPDSPCCYRPEAGLRHRPHSQARPVALGLYFMPLASR